jgi:hypothetical protein
MLQASLGGGAVRSEAGDWRPDRDVRRLHSVGCALMGRRRKRYDRIVGGQSDANIPFEQTVNMLKYLRFDERISGSHHIFTREGIEEIIDILDVGGECKPYQVRQMRTGHVGLTNSAF